MVSFIPRWCASYGVKNNTKAREQTANREAQRLWQVVAFFFDISLSLEIEQSAVIIIFGRGGGYL